jgi:hypothetical protein
MTTGREHHERIGIKMAWNENFGTKVQNWGHVFTPKFGKMHRKPKTK